MEYAQFITGTLTKARSLALTFYGNVTNISVKEQDNNQVLTEADLVIGTFIVSEVKKHYPDHNIIDEEAGVVDKKSDYTWVIDPIDGTSNFAAGLPTFGIMIGLLYKHKPIAGGISLPVLNELCVAEQGNGTVLNGKPIKVTAEKKLSNTLIAYLIDGHPEMPQQTKAETKILADVILAARNIRTSGSAFDIVSVAKGAYGGIMNQTSKIWDNVAPHIIIEEAGGKYTDFWGAPIDYSKALHHPESNFTICAGSASIHSQLLLITSKHRAN